MINYLKDVKILRVESKTPEEMIEKLIKKYSDHGLKSILHMSVPILYKGKY